MSATQKAIDDRIRAVGDRKHPPVSFRFQLHAEAREPLDRIGRLPAMKCREQFPSATRVVFRELSRIKTSMRNIAATTAGDFDLLQKMAAFFKQGNRAIGSHFSKLQCGEKARSAATNHGEIKNRRMMIQKRKRKKVSPLAKQPSRV